MRYLLVLTLFCFCCVTFSHVQPSVLRTEWQQDADAVKVGAVCIKQPDVPRDHRNDDDVIYWWGSGVMIDSYHVLTAQHVVNCDNKTHRVGIFVKFINNEIVEVEVDKQNMFSDMALLRRPDNKKFGIAVKPPVISKAEYMDKLCAAFAYPVRKQSCGYVTEVKGDHILTTHTIVHGNSGSGVFNEKGELIGLVDALQECNADESGKKKVTCGGIVISLWDHLDMLPD